MNASAEVNIDKIKERISKLLRMAEDASSPNEAAIAATRARKLMDKHQIDSRDLNDGFSEAFGASSAGHFVMQVPKYKSIFAVSVAKYNDCIASFEYDYSRKKQAARPIFKGYKSDAELASQMYLSLLSSIDRLRKEHFRAIGQNQTAKLAEIFSMAAVMEITSRLKALTVEREQLMTEATTGTSLIVVKTDAVAAYYGAPKYRDTNVCRNVKNDDDIRAYHAGTNAGRRVEINTLID